MSSSNMFPSKNIFEYYSEINRLFPRTPENESQTPPNLNNVFMHSLFNNAANQSSSSADSASPDAFPQSAQSQQYHNSIAVKNPNNTPIKRQRAIVGRKILGTPQYSTAAYDRPMLSPVKNIDNDDYNKPWPDYSSFSRTPPNTKMFDQRNYTPNYELFPVENRGFELKTPVTTPPRAATPFVSNISPNSTMSVSPVTSNITQGLHTPQSMYRRNTIPHFRPSSSSINIDIPAEKICTFCRKNGETAVVYMTHTVKEMIGNRNVVTCPILRSHVCSTCGAYGDNAHTITYCPVLRSKNNGRPLQSTTITLKNTRVKSNGRKRY